MTIIPILLIALLFLPVAVLQTMMPFLTRKTVSFGISVSEELYYSQPVAQMRKQYVRSSIVLYSTLLVLFITVSSLGGETVQNITIPSYVLLMLAGSGTLYLLFYFRMKRYKSQLPAIGTIPTKLAVDTNFRRQRLALSNGYYLIHAVLIALCSGLALTLYSRYPDVIPMQYNFQGEVTRSVAKSYGTVLFPNIMQLFVTLLLMFVNWIIQKSKQQLSPSNPEKSARQNATFRFRWSIFNFFASIMLVLLFSYMQFTMIYTVDSRISLFIALLVPLIIVCGALYLSYSTGQGGSRIGHSQEDSSSDFPVNDDRYWKLGGFYYNRQDSSIFVEKRTGIGWTMNFAKPLAWLFFLAPLVVILLLVLIFQ